jgi:Kelch motif/Galactose oxidase, central domain
MNAPHTQQPSTLLPDGRVLVTGTLTCNPNCYSGNATELYNPTANSWTVIAPPSFPRFNHVQELLPNGKVLVAGGYWEPGIVLNSAEIFDPAAATWTLTGSFYDARQFHKSAVLLDGRVLIVGGLGTNFQPLGSAELFDPRSGTWTFAGNMRVPRFGHSATTLLDGRVLVVGGTSTNDQNSTPLSSAEIYDPASGNWSGAASMSVAREGLRSVLLPNGDVLVAGGYSGTGRLASSELYDPVADRWTTTGSMTVPRGDHSLTVLPNGRVLAVGGNNGPEILNSSETYDPGTGTWSAAAGLTQARENHSATLLATGKVLVAGGDNSLKTDSSGLASAEVYGTTADANGVISVSAASFFDNGAVAADSIASAFGSWTATGGINVSVRDSAGAVRHASVLAALPGQINYIVPSGTAPGTATVNLNQGSNAIASGQVVVDTVAPGIFCADSSGQGFAAALALTEHADGSQSY